MVETVDREIKRDKRLVMNNVYFHPHEMRVKRLLRLLNRTELGSSLYQGVREGIKLEDEDKVLDLRHLVHGFHEILDVLKGFYDNEDVGSARELVPEMVAMVLPKGVDCEKYEDTIRFYHLLHMANRT